ncbi:hypothetical protein JTE90_014270 [Oedothorax gibbosus]|uniref:Uncharacterized protein n=1 Tax=Oedothorax gibbosus TaxID=931172 RepID=A0AAV6TZK8_9ARAC|nr:hypothetical protein JTE90_014270 [Oedothorax gibbosus]
MVPVSSLQFRLFHLCTLVFISTDYFVPIPTLQIPNLYNIVKTLLHSSFSSGYKDFKSASTRELSEIPRLL